MIRLGVNIDHIATLRNARGESYPSPVQAAVFAELGGADNITCHLREDRRHMRDRDVELLRELIQLPLNFEMAVTDEMLSIAKKLKAHAVTLVPEKRKELTTEGGLALEAFDKKLARSIEELKDLGILVSLFIEADPASIELSAKLGAQAIEIHTGDFCRAMAKAVTRQEQLACLAPLQEASKLAHNLGLQVHVGHGLNYTNAYWMQALDFCQEANIGHAIISRSVFSGLEASVREMKNLLNDDRYHPDIF